MDNGSITAVFGILLLAVILGSAAVFVYRRKKGKKKIQTMQQTEKWEYLSSLTEPFGFTYEPMQDSLFSHLDAWQREQGYMALYDRLAPKFHMVFDAYPVYFDYQDKTWLIEFWKGQYGISVGAEVGVYHANRIIPKEQRALVWYNAVSDEEMPFIGLCLKNQDEKLVSCKQYHWWLAAFRMGRVCRTKNLQMYVNLLFAEEQAAKAFCTGLQEAGFEKETYRRQERRVSVSLAQTNAYEGRQRLYRGFLQCIHVLYCQLYRWVTAPFTKTADRMLFLYFQLPWCFKHMLRLHAFGKKHK